MNAPAPQRTQQQVDDDKFQDNLVKTIMSFLWNQATDLSNWLTLIVIGVVGYFALQNDKFRGKLNEWFGNGFGDKARDTAEGFLESAQTQIARWTGMDVSENLAQMPDEKLQARLASEGLPPAATRVIAQNRPTLLAAIKTANGGRISIDDLTNDKTVFALLTQHPRIVIQIIEASTKADGSKAALPSSIAQSLQTIVADEARLKALLTTHRANMIAMLKAAQPDVDKQYRLDVLIEKGIVNGVVKPELRALIAATIGGDAEKIKGATETFVAAIGPVAMVQIIKPEGINDTVVRSVVTELQKPNSATSVAFTALTEKLSAQKTGEFTTALMQPGDKAPALIQLARTPGILPEFIAFGAALPRDVTKDFPVDIAKLDVLIKAVGPQTSVMQQFMTHLQSAIPSALNQPINPASLVAPMTKLIVSGEVLDKADAQRAAKDFITSINTNAIPQAQRAAFAQMQRLLADGKSGTAVFALLKSLGEAKAEQFVGMMGNAGAQNELKQLITQNLSSFKAFAAAVNLDLLPPNVKAALQQLQALSEQQVGTVQAIATQPAVIAADLDVAAFVSDLKAAFAARDANDRPVAPKPEAMIDWLMNDTNRKNLRVVGLEKVIDLVPATERSVLMSERNLGALLKFADVVAKTPETTKPAIAALLALVRDGEKSIKDMNDVQRNELATTLSTFFGNAENKEAVAALLNELEANALDSKSQKILAVLRKEFITGNGGLAAVFGNKEAVAYVLTPAAPAPAAPSFLDRAWGAMVNLGVSNAPDSMLSDSQKILRDNKSALEALKNAWAGSASASLEADPALTRMVAESTRITASSLAGVAYGDALRFPVQPADNVIVPNTLFSTTNPAAQALT